MSEASIFAAALETNPEERAAYLAEVCAGDEKLRRRVEALLLAHEGDDDVLPPAHGAGGAVHLNAIAEKPGDRIGQYKLMEQIGEGGFGLVFVAEQQEPLRRKVALKVIKPGMDTKQVIARFEAERQALAVMDHPNIARVFEAGATASGRPYFVMELVRGIPITDYCDQHRLCPRERLELFVTVCQAIQHAHQKGIIHRDIKPSNVLVTSHDGKPVAKVIDFGVAKAINQHLTEQTIYTQFAQMIGTPLYMSPEQAEMSGLDIDTRSDIYSLGVLLYELLTGTTPLEKKRLLAAAYDEVRRLIREEEPPKPSTRLSQLSSPYAPREEAGHVSRSESTTLAFVAALRNTEPAKLAHFLRGEVDWIVMKALEKDRTQRYETANDLGRDIERYLRGDPVEARSTSALYRLRKLVRRNKGPVVAIAGFAVFTVLGMMGLIVGIVAVNAERRRTEDALLQVSAEQAKTQLALAAESNARQQTRQALNTMTDQVIEDLLAKQPELGDDERAFLRKVLDFYQAFAAEKGETAEARFVAADGQYRVAKVQSVLGETGEALAGYREAVRLLEKLAADVPSRPDYCELLAASHNNLGNSLVAMGRPKDAEAAYGNALTIRMQLASDFPAVPEYRKDLAATHNNLGNLLWNFHRPAEAATAYRDGLKLLRQLVSDFPDCPHYRQMLGQSLINFGTLLANDNVQLEGEEPLLAYRDAVATFERLAADFPARAEYRDQLARAYDFLCNHQARNGAVEYAEIVCHKALALRKQLAAEFPARPDYRYQLAGSHYNLGMTLAFSRRYPEAEDAYRNALTLHKQLAADFPAIAKHQYMTAATLGALGSLAKAQRNCGEACRWLGESRPYAEAALKANARHPYYRACWSEQHQQLAEAQLELRDHVAAAAAAEEVPKLDWHPDSANYSAACLLARCASLAEKDPKLAEPKRRQLALGYAERAMHFLHKAVQKSYRNIEHMKKDKDLDVLREREDFRQLLKKAEAMK